MKEEKDIEDGVSNLPEHIWHNILSFLKPKEAAKTSVLSKAWLSTVRTRPNLHFIFEGPRLSDADIQVFERRFGDFINCINTTLLRYHENQCGIDSLKLKLNGYTFPTLVPNPHHVNTWLRIAVENGVKSLDIDIHNSSMWTATIFEAKSLVELCLSGKSQLNPQVIKIIRCCCLRKLCLFQVDTEDVMFQRIISSCPLIEILEISRCVGLLNVKVTKLQKLKQFSVDFRGRGYVEVDAPSLEEFSCTCHSDFWGGAMPCGLQIYASKNLKRLSLNNVETTAEFFLGIAENFPQLEDLTIRRCQSLQTIKISSPTIKCINLEKNSELTEARIDVPSIVRFVCKENFIPLLSVRAPSGGWDSDITLSWKYNLFWGKRCFSELKQLLTNLHQSEISLHINFPRVMVGFTEDEMRNSAIFPLPQVQKLSLGFWEEDYQSPTLHTIYLILDGIFWICRPKTIVHYLYQDSCLYRKDVVKVLFEMLVFRRNQMDSTLKQTKVWQQDLKDVKLEMFKGQRVNCLELLDWKTFLKLIEPEGCNQRTRLVFSLEWETDMTRKRKRTR